MIWFKMPVSSHCSLRAKMCHPVGKFIHGFLWMTRKWIMALPMSNCLTDPILWRRRITLELDYLLVILELQYTHYDRHEVLLCFLSLTFTYSLSWWRHQKETFSALLALCAGNSSVTGEFLSQRPMKRSFDVFFDLRLSKRLSKQSRLRWFEPPSRSLWRQV